MSIDMVVTTVAAGGAARLVEGITKLILPFMKESLGGDLQDVRVETDQRSDESQYRDAADAHEVANGETQARAAEATPARIAAHAPSASIARSASGPKALSEDDSEEPSLSDAAKIANYHDPAKKTFLFIKQNFSVFWSVVVVLMFVVSYLLIAFLDDTIVALYLTTFLWALWAGVSMLVFVSEKLIVAFLGFFLGIGSSEATTGAGWISNIHTQVSEIAGSLVPIVQELGGSTDLLFLRLVWLFFIVVALLCIPAFMNFSEEN